MNWLLEEVEGRIPEVEELMPFSRETAGLLRLKTGDSGPAAEEAAEESGAADGRNSDAEAEKNGKKNTEDGTEAAE